MNLETAVDGLISAARAQASCGVWSLVRRDSVADRKLLLQAQGERLPSVLQVPSKLLLIVKVTDP